MAEFKFIAGWTLSNFGGVGVIETDGDSMLIQYYEDEPERVEIEYDEEGAPFIKVGQLELSLNDCMRY